ncbi:DUF6625 family protein [Aequorivita antarctica]|uniref:Glycosyl transferase n=1 Tax=Aequorivita antarctica TaxID=153266 RepID=A0A5C6YXY3_9FLAO|nr:DUF6625 family protein [Aequorivita antarctica]TXD72496.1 hypothetical protein ESU54_11830 [Aequorivita antarctica]SRX76502.1 hypothetical protein AEQU3_03502 [Aequorivita antarctica]
MHSIILIIPYFGKWPVWFDAYLCSVKTNPTINWLCPTDCEIPKNHPENIIFVPTTLVELNKHINLVVDANVPLNARKFCDLKPAYGDIFNEYIEGFDFWGICDMDIIWGDIRKFMTPEILNNFDIICSRPEAISGHFNLFRNTEKINSFYKSIPNYKTLFEMPKFMWFDEVVLTEHLKNLIGKDENPYRVFWDSELIKKGIESEIHQEYYLDRWLYKKGKIIDLFDNNKKEYMYLHFINWKRTMTFSEIKYKDKPQQFYISYKGMHFKPHSSFSHRLNAIKNFYNGYYVLVRRIKWEKKIMSLRKRVINRLARIK